MRHLEAAVRPRPAGSGQTPTTARSHARPEALCRMKKPAEARVLLH